MPIISEELRKYIELVDVEWAAGELFEMARVGQRRHGIENVVIWVGEASKQHGLRVKISNVPNKMRVEDSFTIMMPSLDYDPAQVATWITPKIMKRILGWIKLNQKQLLEYETGVIFDTDDFLKSLVKE